MRLTIRLLVAVFVVLPMLAMATAVLDYQSNLYRPSFLNTFLTNLALVYIYGSIPAILTCLAHTQLTQNRKLSETTRPRLYAAGWGLAIGACFGVGLGLLMSLIAVSLVPWFLLGGGLWGGCGGLLYGALVGPASTAGRAA